MQLTVDTDGQVLGAEIIESAGDVFDDAALRTIERYQFTPAIDENNQPILVQIQYRLVFNPELLPPVNVRGRVKKPVSGPTGKCAIWRPMLRVNRL